MVCGVASPLPSSAWSSQGLCEINKRSDLYLQLHSCIGLPRDNVLAMYPFSGFFQGSTIVTENLKRIEWLTFLLAGQFPKAWPLECHTGKITQAAVEISIPVLSKTDSLDFTMKQWMRIIQTKAPWQSVLL